ncbi:MAG: hypothetical protein U9O98_05945 [Asgard group archaeon]|nr:hypothetical protein [Asgard group archaeon]
MEISIWQTVPSILAIIVSSIILVLLILNYILNKFIPSLIFIFFFVGIDLWSITKLVSVFLPSSVNILFVRYWKMTSLTILILSLLLITFFRDLLMSSTLAIPSVIVAFTSGFTIAALWLGDFVTVNFNSISGWNTDYNLLFLILLLIDLLLVYAMMFVMLFKGLNRATQSNQRIQIILIILGLGIAGIGGTILNYILNLIPTFATFGDLDMIFVVAGFTIVAFAYLRSPIQIYFAPITAYRLLIMNNDGIPLLSHDFCQIEDDTVFLDSSLISSALSGVVGILQETLDSDYIPNTIELEDKVLLLEKSHLVLAAIIADSDSMVLRAALKDFTREFETRFGKKLRNWNGLVDDFKEAKSLITEDFAFLFTSSIPSSQEPC